MIAIESETFVNTIQKAMAVNTVGAPNVVDVAGQDRLLMKNRLPGHRIVTT